MRVVFMNGPPGCGKDTVVSHLTPYLQFTHLKFAAPIKRMVCALIGEDLHWLEENKDKQHKMLMRNVDRVVAEYDIPRELLIEISESFLKPRYGQDFFGRVMVNEISKSMNQLVLISDSGFLHEVEPVIKKYGALNCMHIQISRNGCSFAGDSRSYWEHKSVHRRLIVNGGTIHDLTMSVLYAIVKRWPDIEPLKDPQWIK